MGLKQMIDKAMQGDADAVATLPPVQISGEAHRAYANLVRQWTGWKNATLKFGVPEVSPFASCHRGTHVVTANPERLLLNPHRVLLTINPFRLRQEAVLTGALLHEAGHARHSNWIPRSEIDAEAFKHSDGSAVTKAEMALAKCLEEPRVEGLVAAEAGKIGAGGLEWTMRASAAHLVPMTDLSNDPDQAVIDLIRSWALRAGRQMALAHHIDHRLPNWVGNFTALLHDTIFEHLLAQNGDAGVSTACTYQVIEWLAEMSRGTAATKGHMFQADAAAESDGTTFMIDHAKSILEVLFPETPPDQRPQAGGACGAGEGEDESPSNGVKDIDEGDAEADEAGTGEDNSDPEDEGAGDKPGAGQSGGDGDDEGDSEGDSEDTDTESAVAKALKEIEGQAKSESVVESKADATKPPEQDSGMGAGAGPGSAMGGGWRRPTIEERGVKDNAERFLRDLIDPNPTGTVRITDQPSAMIDGAALAAWKAGGQVKAPRFFKQVKRTVRPTPPVKIAVLVDVSMSMNVLQKPSALLSWALAAACLDLRNFAGGGTKVESTLIHWGDSAQVIQRNGEVLPGIREVSCHDGTTAMHMAYDLIEEQIPDFFTVKEHPENKLIVHFTDWRLASHKVNIITQAVGRGLEAGATMLSVVPAGYSARYSNLPGILADCKIQRGRNHLMRYDPTNPEAVWATAAKVLA